MVILLYSSNPTRGISRGISLRLLLVDDNDRVRANLRTRLACQDDWQICGEGADGGHN